MTSVPSRPGARRGPRREPGSPSGPVEVRRAVLDSAARLFAERGVAGVSLRDLATAANVHVSLITRYVGSREELVRAVFDDLAASVAHQPSSNPRQQQRFDRDSDLGRWLTILAHWMLSGEDPRTALGVANPIQTMADVLVEHNGLEPRAARIRATQIVGSALGWRLFEPYLIAAGDLADESSAVLHDELTAIHQRIGATPLIAAPHQPL